MKMCLATRVVLIVCFIVQVHGVVRNYKFEVMNSPHTRLCNTKTMLTVNGQFPGPTIYARRGDLIIVDVINRADQNISIHWHGVKMPRYPWADGPEYVTQCPISPGAKFTQRIILSDEEGTLWWHGHTDWSRATVYGAIIILPPKTQTYPFPKPHAQVPILLGEWWNADIQYILDDFRAKGREPLISDAFLINGQPGALYPCSTQDAYKLRVEFGKTYLMRMVNAMMNFIIYFRIAGHNMTVVGSDGAYTKPLNSDYIAISPGQTIDFLLEANQPPSHYYMLGRVYASGTTDYVPTTGIIEYVGNYTPPPSPLFPVFPEYATLYDSSGAANNFMRDLRSLGNGKLPIDVDENLFYVVAINEFPCHESTCKEPDRLLASVNNMSMVQPNHGPSILDAYYRGINGVYTADFPDYPPVAFNYAHGNYSIEKTHPEFGNSVKLLGYNSTVEIVFQATNYRYIDHPMHFHGYSFHVVGSGFGNFDPIKDPPNYNLVDPPLLSTVLVPRNGWATIRFRANNPGVWFMHCHFERHQAWGMGMVFIVTNGERPDEKMLPPPSDMPLCNHGNRSSDSPLLSSHLEKFSYTIPVESTT